MPTGGASGAASGDEAAPIPRIPLLLKAGGLEDLVSPIDRRSETYRHIAATVHPPQPQQQRQPLTTIPNVLTFIRLVMVPVMLVLWESEMKHAPILCAVIFIGASITDWLDGYLARRLKVATVFGAFLDPVADKVMVATALILLTTSPPPPLKPKVMVLPVVLMICREITMSAIREWAAAAGGAAHKAVKVNSYGKWKTALQMVSMSLLLVVRQPQQDLLPNAAPNSFVMASYVAFAMLWGATFLALLSLYIYFANVWTHFVNPPAKTHAH